MPAKPYEKRIEKGLGVLKDDSDVRGSTPLFNRASAARDVGDIFLMVADFVEDHPQAYIAKAFQETNLEPYNPFHWQYLLEAFADVHYGTGKPGRPRTRDDAQLLRDLRSLQKKYGVSSKASLGELLVRDFPDRYPKLAKKEQIRTRLRSVRIKRETKRISLLRKKRAEKRSPTVDSKTKPA